MGFQDFLDKYKVKNIPKKFVDAMDSGVAPALAAAWFAGTPVTGMLGAALALPPGGLIMMPFLELDVTKAIAGILPGTPLSPGVVVPSTPTALLALVTLNPIVPDKARALANAMLDWAVAQAPPVPNPAKGPPAPWPPPFIPV